MALSTAAITTPTTKPIIAGFAQIVDLDAAQWSSWSGGETGDFTDADSTHTGYPSTNAIDASPSFKTMPNASATKWSFCMDFSTTPIDFDIVGFVSSNLSSSDTVDIEIADDNEFTVNNDTIKTFSSIGSGRFCDFLSYRYSDVPYIRATVNDSGSLQPYFGQIILAKRVQLTYNANWGYDSFRRVASRGRFVSQNGVAYESTNFSGQRILAADWSPDNDTDVTALKAWYSTGVANGTKAFCWWEDASTYKNQFEIYKFIEEDLDFAFPRLGPTEYSFRLLAAEQGEPFLANE